MRAYSASVVHEAEAAKEEVQMAETVAVEGLRTNMAATCWAVEQFLAIEKPTRGLADCTIHRDSVLVHSFPDICSSS